MPRRSILSAAEQESLLALPDTNDELIRHYTFSESDLSDNSFDVQGGYVQQRKTTLWPSFFASYLNRRLLD